MTIRCPLHVMRGPPGKASYSTANWTVGTPALEAASTATPTATQLDATSMTTRACSFFIRSSFHPYRSMPREAREGDATRNGRTPPVRPGRDVPRGAIILRPSAPCQQEPRRHFQTGSRLKLAVPRPTGAERRANAADQDGDDPAGRGAFAPSIEFCVIRPEHADASGARRTPMRGFRASTSTCLRRPCKRTVRFRALVDEAFREPLRSNRHVGRLHGRAGEWR